MRSIRTTIGAIVSFAWLCTLAYLAFRDPIAFAKLSPNEWGDFFAGCFAPLAFLWLVLGYMQQGEELQLSTKALQLQAKELSNSVEQQRALVEVTRQQLDSEREARHLERIARQEAAKPLFVISNGGGSFSGATSSYNLQVSNAGNTVTQVVGILEGEGIAQLKLFEYPMFDRSSSGSCKLKLLVPFPETPATLRVSYFDMFGQTGVSIFKVTKQYETSNSMLAFVPVQG
jgi:hypothetical protein